MMAGPDLCGIHTCLFPDSPGHNARLWPIPVLRRHAVACTVTWLRWNPFFFAFIQPLISEGINPFKPPLPFLTLRKFLVVRSNSLLRSPCWLLPTRPFHAQNQWFHHHDRDALGCFAALWDWAYLCPVWPQDVEWSPWKVEDPQGFASRLLVLFGSITHSHASNYHLILTTSKSVFPDQACYLVLQIHGISSCLLSVIIWLSQGLVDLNTGSRTELVIAPPTHSSFWWTAPPCTPTSHPTDWTRNLAPPLTTSHHSPSPADLSPR